MPSLGADMEAGTLLEWRVRPGDTVSRGDIVALVDTDKAEIEIEIFEDGVVEALLIEPGTKVPVGTPIARIAAASSAAHAVAAAAPVPAPRPEPAPVPAAVAATPAAIPLAAPAPPARIHATPLARRLAAELGVDLASLRGQGLGGVITRDDVEAASSARPAPPPGPVPQDAAVARRADRVLAMRRTIAAAMARSKREIPHYYLGSRIDLARALAWLAAENARRPLADRVLPAALLLRAVARAAREVPEMNGTFVDGAFRPAASVHLGVAVSLRGGGLIAPALLDADRKDLFALMRELGDLVQRARGGGLRSSEMGSATLTVTNLGDQGAESVFGVIHPPQVAMVGFGRISEQPWAESGMLDVRPVVYASLAADHRASDGHDGARFLAAVSRLLQEPER
jgi:pyruvate dehydrogenase E2 component (dihydrolipoamide acetyltransferase)